MLVCARYAGKRQYNRIKPKTPSIHDRCMLKHTHTPSFTKQQLNIHTEQLPQQTSFGFNFLYEEKIQLHLKSSPSEKQQKKRLVTKTN